MTKRFTYEYDEYSGNLFDNKMNTFYHIEDSDENIEVLCDRLNWLVEKNEQLKEQREKLFFRERDTKNRWRELKQENEQLKERNQRQAKHLAELYELMAKKDWESLTEIIDDFCSCEEQLQREWKCYE